MTTPEDQRPMTTPADTLVKSIQAAITSFRRDAEFYRKAGHEAKDAGDPDGANAIAGSVTFKACADRLELCLADAVLASLPQGPPASTSELGRIEPIPAIALLRTFSFPAYPQLFQSTDGGCTEVLIEDADVQKVRDFLKFSSEPDQQPADDSEGRAAAEEKPSALPQARAVGDEEVEAAARAHCAAHGDCGHSLCDPGVSCGVKPTEVEMSAMRAALATLPPAPGWRCFHCDETFADEACAREHFGAYQDCDPICKVGAERYRDLEDQLAVFRNESDAASKEFYALGAKHTQERMRAEEQGYERGLRDARHEEIWRAFLKAHPLPAPGWRGEGLMDGGIEMGLHTLLQLAVNEMQSVVEAVNHQHDTRQNHMKYSTPYGAINGMVTVRENILVQCAMWGIEISPHRSVPAQPLPSPPSPSEEVG